MKRCLVSVVLVMCMCVAAGLQAQEGGDAANQPVLARTAGAWGGNSQQFLARQLSMGLGVWRAYWSRVTFEGGLQQDYLFEPTYLISAGMKYFFYGSNFGVGMDGVFMDSYKQPYTAAGNAPAEGAEPAGTATVTQWLFDINAYYRYPLFRSLNLLGGAGLTCNYVDMGEIPNKKDEFSAAGWNVKAGVEFFIADDISFSLFATYHSFKQGAVVAGIQNKNANVKLTSFMLMGNFYL